MSEELLDGIQIRTVIQQFCSQSVSEHVRRLAAGDSPDPLQFGFDCFVHIDGIEFPSSRCQEQGTVSIPVEAVRKIVQYGLPVQFQFLTKRRNERNLSGLVTLAPDSQDPPLKVSATALKANEFGPADGCIVEYRHYQTV